MKNIGILNGKNDGSSRVTVSSFPINASSSWDGKVDGVQKEPLSLWTGSSSGACKKVGIYDMRKKYWIWDWFNSGFRYESANENDYKTAVNYAVSQMGKAYN